MPAFIKTKKDEKKWKRAKDAVKKRRKKNYDQFSDKDWGLVNHIYQTMEKSRKELVRYVVYSIRPKTGKKITHQSYDDKSEANEHVKQLRKLYGKYIQVGIDEEVARSLPRSIRKAKEIIKGLGDD